MEIDIGKKGGYDPTLGSPFLGILVLLLAGMTVNLDCGTAQPIPDKPKDTPIRYTPLKVFHKLGVVDVVKEAHDVRVHYSREAGFQVGLDDLDRIMGRPVRTETI
jgi:hypothetical protein